MKIIDLLNKIANGEEVPKKFISNGHSYELIKYPTCGKEIINYKDEDGDYLFGCEYELGLIINQEIIEEEKEIEKLDIIKEGKDKQFLVCKQDEIIADKINELIDVINEMRDKE